MTRKLLTTMVAALFLGLPLAHAQTEAQKKYLKKTRNVAQKGVAAADSTQQGGESTRPTDFIGRYFPYVSMCDWEEGMRFMVIPEHRDLVIKTFADSTGRMVPSNSLKYKVMVYQGHEKMPHELHERVNFFCEDDSAVYYFSVPTASFDDYCSTRAGVPTLAYLGDVDIAQSELIGKTLFTLQPVFYRDTEANGDGYEEVRVPLNTEVTVVDVGVGTRRFPVKLIVADKDSTEFFQYVAISRTNCGIRDEEFAKDLTKHSFQGSFELLADNLAASSAYTPLLGRQTYTLYATSMKDAEGRQVNMPRLSKFTIKDVRVQRGTEYVRLTLTDVETRHEYTKDVLMVDTDEDATLDGQHNNIFKSLFVVGDPLDREGINPQHMTDIQKGVVRTGFTEAEVELALGRPTGQGSNNSQYTWVYKRPGQPYVCVYFNTRTKRVATVKR